MSGRHGLNLRGVCVCGLRGFSAGLAYFMTRHEEICDTEHGFTQLIVVIATINCTRHAPGCKQTFAKGIVKKGQGMG